MATENKVTIVGGGLSGPLMAVLLARRGFRVDLYESRTDPRQASTAEGRSINLTIAARGLAALARVGLDQDVVAKLGVPGRSRVVHDPRGAMMPVAQGRDEHEVLYAVSRNDLTALLLDEAERQDGVRLHFRQRCVGLDADTATVVFADVDTGAHTEAVADFVVGADGTYSTVRRLMQRGEFVDFHQHYVDWRYREVSVAATASSQAGFDPQALHVWPRGDRIMFALPNLDGSFNGVCVLPASGPNSFDSLRTPADVTRFFETNFPDVVPHAPDLVANFLGGPPAGFPTMRTSAWYRRDTVVLVGDACHTVIPFYGQGMNAAFEDCAVLDDCLAERPHDRAAAFAAYQAARKADTDVLAELSMANFDEIRDTRRLPQVLARRRLSLALSRLVDSTAMPLYAMVTYTTLPYTECLRRARRQDRIARWLGLDVALGLSRLVGLLRRPPAPPHGRT